MKTLVLIPAFKPSGALVDVVASLVTGPVDGIVVVDDGSGPEFGAVFEHVRQLPGVRLLRHAINLGKGAALKTGINHCLCEDSGCLIVTADADGQHLAQDILLVAKHGRSSREALVLGARSFDGEVPLRSRIGNVLTRHVLRLVLGYALRDTQTGLRAIPSRLAPHLLKLASRRYEFELDMLILCKQLGVPIEQRRIETVYLEGNAASHFNPLLDSMRIYFALVRFLFTSLGTALLDNAAFAATYAAISPIAPLKGAILASQVSARAAAMIFNYAAVKRLVFASRQSNARVIPKYVLLVAGAAAVSYMAITFLAQDLGMNVILAKILVESALFLPNFVIQRDIVFRNRTQDEVIDAD